MKVKVQVQQDYLEKHINKRNLFLALSELIWNSLDGDATRVDLSFTENGLGAVDEISVQDNGHGISFERAKETFEKLGNSWKKTAVNSPAGRKLHGRGGEGRFSAFALGRHVTWTSRTLEKTSKPPIKSIKILGNLDAIGEFEINEITPKQNEKIGTEVVISNLVKSVGTLTSDKGKNKIAEFFAIYLKSYAAKIYMDGTHIDPSVLEESTFEGTIPKVVLSTGKSIDVKLTIIEWRHKVERSIILCDKNGFPLSEANTAIQAPGYNFSVYVSCPLIEELHSAGTLDLPDLNSDLTNVIEKVRAFTKEHFRQKSAEKSQSIVQEWKQEKVYPFKDEPKTPVEQVERQVFDVVALQINEYLPDFAKSDVKNKKFSLQMLKSAIERSPQEAQRIIQEVLQLPKEKQEELAELLERTQLSSIINAAKMVSDRLEFLAGLDALIFSSETKGKVRERKHLHRIIAENTWVFGEEFNLSVDDQSLTEVLKKHIGELGDENRKDLIPAVDLEGNTAIVDLMLSRRIPQPRAEEREHLIVELKRPSQKIDSKCTAQIEKYAFAVAEDERFRDTKTTWNFLIVSNDMDSHTRRKVTKQADRPDGLLHISQDLPLKIWVKTWSQIIEECKGRLKFFESGLDYRATHDSGLEYLQKTHSKYLPDEKATPKSQSSKDKSGKTDKQKKK